MSSYGLGDSGLERPVEPASAEWALPDLDPSGAQRPAQVAPATPERARSISAPALSRHPGRLGAVKSSEATGALIAGIVGLFFFPIVGSIVALALGYSARRAIDRTGGATSGRSNATVGIALGWIGLAIWLLLLLLLGAATGGGVSNSVHVSPSP